MLFNKHFLIDIGDICVSGETGSSSQSESTEMKEDSLTEEGALWAKLSISEALCERSSLLSWGHVRIGKLCKVVDYRGYGLVTQAT